MKLSMMYMFFGAHSILANNALAEPALPNDTLSIKIREQLANLDAASTLNSLNTKYYDFIPDHLNKEAYIEYATNGGDPIDITAGPCPYLCMYYPCHGFACCTKAVAEDSNCVYCYSSNGECTACKPGYSINQNGTCKPNRSCTHTNDGYCTKCSNGNTVSTKTLLCVENRSCTHIQHGICDKCKPTYMLNSAAVCVKKTHSPSMQMN